MVARESGRGQGEAQLVVMVTAQEGQDAEAVGPFPDGEWAARYVERVGRLYYKLEIKLLLSPRLIGRLTGSETDDRLVVLFDPAEGIDR